MKAILDIGALILTVLIMAVVGMELTRPAGRNEGMRQWRKRKKI